LKHYPHKAVSDMNIRLKLLLAVTATLLSSTISRANVVLPDVISEAMVLQRDTSVPIWGKADPGEVVEVRFAGQSKKVTAGQDGRWFVSLIQCMRAQTPATMTISGNNTIELRVF